MERGLQFRKKRSRNFAVGDRNLLLGIVSRQKYSKILENKKTDNVSVGAKNAAWAKITQEYNASALTGERTSKQLSALYNGLKGKAQKKNTYATGDGTYFQENTTGDGTYFQKNTQATGDGTLIIPKTEFIDEELASVLKPPVNPYNASAVYNGNDFFADETENCHISEPVNNSEACSSATPNTNKKSSGESPRNSTRKQNRIVTVVRRKNRTDGGDEDVKRARLEVIALEKLRAEKEMERLEEQMRQDAELFILEKLKRSKEIELLEIRIRKETS